MNVSRRFSRSGIIASSVLIGLSFSPHSRAQTKAEGVLPDNAPAVRTGYPAIDRAGRRELLENIEKSVQELGSVKGDDLKLQLAAKVESALARYEHALFQSEDADQEELEKALNLAVYKLNVASFRDSLPAELRDSFISGRVLGLHLALLDFLQVPSRNIPPERTRSLSESLLRDLLWTETYRSQDIFKAASQNFADRIFKIPDDELPGRLNLMKDCLNSYGKDSDALFHSIVQLLERRSILARRDLLHGAAEVLQSFDLKPSRLDEMSLYARGNIQKPLARPLFLECVGPAIGILLVKSEGPSKVSEQMQALLAPDVEKTGPGGNSLPPFVRAALLHAIHGWEDPGYWGKAPLRTSQDLEAMAERRISCAFLTLGMLHGFDHALKEGPAGAKEKDLPKVREETRTSLELMLADGLTDEQRAEVFVALLASDNERFELMQDALQYSKDRLKRMGRFFPPLELANEPGRYSSKVGNVRYYPPIQVAGDPAPYVDQYFYLREALSPRMKDGNRFAREFSKACSDVFLAEVALGLIAESPERRPVDIHRSLTDEAMRDEVREVLAVFGCYQNDPELFIGIGTARPEEFVLRLKRLAREAKAKRAELLKRVNDVLGRRPASTLVEGK